MRQPLEMRQNRKQPENIKLAIISAFGGFRHARGIPAAPIFAPARNVVAVPGSLMTYLGDAEHKPDSLVVKI